MPPAALEDLGDDSYLVSTARGVPAGSLTIASSKGSARGTMYGAFALLRALGFEFFAENASRFAKPLPTTLPAMDNFQPKLREPQLARAGRRATGEFCRPARMPLLSRSPLGTIGAGLMKVTSDPVSTVD